MRRVWFLVLLSLGSAFLAVVLAIGKPGLPMTLKADEPAYYLMALSLAHDGDLLCEPRDIDRLFQEYPFLPVQNLILMTDDGWQTTYFGKPWIYPAVAAPLAGLFGANGLVATNVLLLLAMIAMGASWLRRWNPAPVAGLFAVGFFGLSSAAAYVFWLHPEILNMASIMACLYCGLWTRRRVTSWRSADLLLVLASGALLAPAVYNKPMLAAIGLPVLFRWARRREWRAVAAWMLGAVAASLVLCGGSLLLTGHPSAYLGVARGGIPVTEPGVVPTDALVRFVAERATETPNSWSWIFRVPSIDPHRLAEDVGYFLWGRHTGLVLYLPFAVVALVLFLVHERKSAWRWGLVASLGLVAFSFLLFIPFNWHGGAGFVGNRYFVNVYPAFLFLVGRIRPRVAVPVGYALGGLLCGPLLLTPFGAPVPNPTLQAHVRNHPFPMFPLELSLLNQIPGYRGQAFGDLWTVFRRDQVRPTGEELWILGGSRAELWLNALEPLERPVLLVRDPSGSGVELRLGDGEGGRGTVGGGEPGRGKLALDAGEPVRVADVGGRPRYQYRLVVEAPNGRLEPLPVKGEGLYYVGAGLAYLGEETDLARDRYVVEWGRSEIPARVAPGATVRIPARLWNRSEATWPALGASRVNASYHWRTSDGESLVFEGGRTPLPRPVGPDERVVLDVVVEAPAEPGTYELELDLVHEHVAWFSRRGAEMARATVVVGGASDP